MFVPPYALLLKSLGLGKSEITEHSHIEVPVELLEFLMKCVLATTAFDQDHYLGAHPDIAGAVRSGSVRNPRVHFITNGYFEGRAGTSVAVDERWYLETYPDVRAAVEGGRVASAREHYESTGVHEWRVPNPAIEPEIRAWRKCLERK